MKTVPLTRIQEELQKLGEKLRKQKGEYVIAVRDAPQAAHAGGKQANLLIMSPEEYESLKETEEILADKSLMKDIREAEKEFERGEYTSLEELEKELEEEENV